MKLETFVNELRKAPYNAAATDFISAFRENMGFLELLGQCVYIVDYKTGKYLFVSQPMLDLLEMDRESFMNGGLMEVLQRIVPQDQERVAYLITQAIAFVNELPDSLRSKVSNKLFYRMHSRSGITRWMMQTNRIVHLNGWLDIGFLNLVTEEKIEPPPYALITFGKHHHIILPEGESKPEVPFSRREAEVFFWSKKGLLVREISERLNITEAGVRFHRRNILKKMGKRNFAGI